MCGMIVEANHTIMIQNAVTPLGWVFPDPKINSLGWGYYHDNEITSFSIISDPQKQLRLRQAFPESVGGACPLARFFEYRKKIKTAEKNIISGWVARRSRRYLDSQSGMPALGAFSVRAFSVLHSSAKQSWPFQISFPARRAERRKNNFEFLIWQIWQLRGHMRTKDTNE